MPKIDTTAEVLAAAADLTDAFPRVAYVQRNAVKLATIALRRVQAKRSAEDEQALEAAG